ncbi:LysR family transcriptional regulator [Castellaniella sp. UC4442_H9]
MQPANGTLPAQNIDLKLLAIFVEMLLTGSVSQTAKHLNLGQPTVSMSLARLRKCFSDPLFVRTSDGMKPTPLALDLRPSLTQAYQSLLNATRDRADFDPHTSDRLFRIAMINSGYLSVSPRLLELQRTVAPSIRFHFSAITKDISKLMEAGEVDLAITFMSQLGSPNLYQQQLLKQGFVAVVRHDHPRVRKNLSMEDYEREQHLSISPVGTGGHWVPDIAIEQAGIRRRVSWRVESVLGILPIIGISDLIATIPNGAAQFLKQQGLVRVFPLPFETPTMIVMQHWHERFHRDSGLRWLRGQLLTAFATVDWATVSATETG